MLTHHNAQYTNGHSRKINYKPNNVMDRPTNRQTLYYKYKNASKNKTKKNCDTVCLLIHKKPNLIERTTKKNLKRKIRKKRGKSVLHMTRISNFLIFTKLFPLKGAKYRKNNSIYSRLSFLCQ